MIVKVDFHPYSTGGLAVKLPSAFALKGQSLLDPGIPPTATSISLGIDDLLTIPSKEWLVPLRYGMVQVTIFDKK